MSSTKPLPPDVAGELEALLAELARAGAAARQRASALVPLGPEPERASYFEPYTADAPEWETVEAAQIAPWLAAWWTQEGWPELAALAPRLAALAARLRPDDDESPPGEVSPLIYQMF